MVEPIGSWLPLGRPGLALGRWFRAPQVSTNPEAMLRLSFIFLNEKFDGYILVRNQFVVNGLNYYCEAAQIYPEDGFTVVELPYPQQLRALGITERYIQFRPRAYNRKYGQGFAPVEIEVYVEELV